MTWFDPATYPGRWPDGPTLVYQGRTWPLACEGTASHPVVPPSEVAEAGVLDPTRRRWVVAYGSNACPERLLDRGLDVRGALLLPCALHGWRAAWEARRSASTGAVPLTLVPHPGEGPRCFALGIDVRDAPLLDAGEFRGTNYLLGRVGDTAVAGRWLLPGALAYGPAAGTKVLAARGATLSYPDYDQAAARSALADERAVTLVADPLPDPVDGPWPAAQLVDLDLFVYGTLRPGGERWPSIASLVTVAGEATASGTLVATFYGWPAATFQPGRGTVHGALLRPRSERAARALYAEVDRIEDEGRLFRRVPVRVRAASGTRWAATYEWEPSQGPPPGTPVDDGRWTG